MNDPDDRTGQGAGPSPMPNEVALHLASWSRTINRWATTNREPSYLITESDLRQATPEDVVDAIDRLRNPRRRNNE